MENTANVAVITSSIGRAELARAIESVANQSYPAKHYVFVDGKQYHAQASAILQNYPDVISTYLPMNTGANGWVNSSINAIAPFLVKEDIICYLDDDNWYEPNHIESLVEQLKQGADYAYSLRNFYGTEGQFICQDHLISLGQWQSKLAEPISLTFEHSQGAFDCQIMGFANHHIDTNCYAFPTALALKLAQSWYSGLYNDRHVFKSLQDWQLQGACSGLYSVNYCADFAKLYPNLANELRQIIPEHQIENALNNMIAYLCEKNVEAYAGTPWSKKP